MVLFFSSRGGADAAVIPKSENSKATIIKSKWYGKQRSATAPPPPLNLSRGQPATTHLDATLLSPSQPPPTGRLSNSLNPKSPKPRQSTSSRQPASPTPPRSDTITMTLAARLNELEASNTEGLLDDEGYRLLRQNLFTSFASSASPPPPEAPPLRLAGPSRIRDSKVIPKSSTDPNFRISKKEGTESIRSNRSRSSTVSTVVSNIFRRGGGGGSSHGVSGSGSLSGFAAGRPSTSSQQLADSDMNDAVSVFSDGSRPSMTQLRRNPSLSYALSHGSSGSINGGGSSDHNSSQHDLLSISSRRTGWSALTGTSQGRTPSRTMRQPPSAYHLRNMILASSSSTSIGSAEDVGEDGDERRQTSAELRAEIAAVEAEYKRIVDNYAGAEMAAVMKRQHHGGGTVNMQPLTPTSLAESTWTMVPSILNGDMSPSKPNGVEKDSPGGKRMVFSRSSVLISSLRRKPSNASSSRTSSSQTQASLSSNSASPGFLRPHNLPVQQHHPAGPHYYLTKSSSSLSLCTSSQSTNGTSISNHPFRDPPSRSVMTGSISDRTLSTSDGGLGSAGIGGGNDMDLDNIDEADVAEVKKAKAQLGKIRNSRSEAVKRYEERLELLRVKLKSAEIHEKLMKK